MINARVITTLAIVATLLIVTVSLVWFSLSLTDKMLSEGNILLAWLAATLTVAAMIGLLPLMAIALTVVLALCPERLSRPIMGWIDRRLAKEPSNALETRARK